MTGSQYKLRWSNTGSRIMVEDRDSYQVVSFDAMCSLDPVIEPLQAAAVQVLADVALAKVLTVNPHCRLPAVGAGYSWDVACLAEDVETVLDCMLCLECCRWDVVAAYVLEPFMPRLWPMLEAAGHDAEAEKLWREKDEARAAWVQWQHERYAHGRMQACA